jgi:hypothetical protein
MTQGDVGFESPNSEQVIREIPLFGDTPHVIVFNHASDRSLTQKDVLY